MVDEATREVLFLYKKYPVNSVLESEKTVKENKKSKHQDLTNSCDELKYNSAI